MSFDKGIWRSEEVLLVATSVDEIWGGRSATDEVYQG